MRISHKSFALVFLTAFVYLFFATTAFAQTERATLEGTVTDPTGGTISGASVKVTAVETSITQERRTNSSGYYRFPGLSVGEYTVTVSNTSFKTKVLDHVILQVGETHTLDVSLDVGAVEDKVEISADAGPAERSTAAAATVITTDQIANLPVNGRDWSSLTLLAPFAQDDGGGDQRTIRFAGRARDDNNFNFDGVDAGGIQEQAQKSQTRLQISEDAVEEYRVNSALYDVEYGTQAGGQINVVTKSGTNDLHGTVFGYLRNSVFDARNFDDFAPDASGNLTIPEVLPFRMGQYGMTVGGPIKKDKTFFFLSYEGLRQLQESTSQGTIFVPSASFVKDILVNGRMDNTQTPAVQVGPTPGMCAILQGFPWRASTGTVGGCAPKIIYPDSDFSALNAAELGQVSLDSNDLPTDIEAFTHPIQTTVHEDTWLVRVDHKFSDKTTLYGRAQRDISLVNAQIGVTVGLDKAQTINHPANYLLALQHIFTTNVFNEAKVYVNRSPFHNPEASTLTYAVNSNNFTGIPNESADIEVGTTYGVVDNMTWTHNRHAFKMGLEYRRVRLNQGQTANSTLGFGDDLSMIGGSTSLNFIAPWCCHRLRRGFFMPYFQDEWKVTPNLTVTSGVRWDYYGVATEATNRTTVFDFNQFHGACLGSGSFNAPFLAPINTPACPTNPVLYNPNYKNFDPRMSVAWAPEMFHGKTVVRAGFGIYHGAAQNDDLNAGLESDTYRVSVSGLTVSPALTEEIPDLSGLSAGKEANHPRALQRENRRDLYAEEWGLTIEHQLPVGFLLSTSYLGSHGARLFSRGGVNLCNTPVAPNNPDTTLVTDCVRPLDPYFPGPASFMSAPTTSDPYGSVDIKRDIGSSFYDALGVSLERRMKNGFSIQTRYTYSHSINDGSVGGGESNGPENVNCLPCDKGPSVFDIRHNFVANAIYELPFGPGKTYLHDSSGVVGKIVEGWEVSSVGMWHTGHPLTVSMGLNSIGTSASPFYAAGNPFSDLNNPGAPFPATLLLPDGNDQTNQRPDIVPGVPLTLPGGGHNGIPLVNPAAFQAPPVDANGFFTRFGNAGNGIIRALPTWQVDLALMKETKITERLSVQFGVQAFNIFNHTQLGDPNQLTLDYPSNPDPANPRQLITKPNFGVITSTVNYNSNNDNVASPNTGTGLPRQLQFMLRFKY